MNVHKVIWQEGMLLRPQHLQHNDRYYEHQIKTRTRLLNGHAWGFFDLELDRQFLSQGQVVISQASGILPDGSLFELGGNTRPVALDIPPNTTKTAVYLALPLVTGNHIESRRADQTDVLARYTAYETEVADCNAGDDAVSDVSCGRPEFRLLLGTRQDDAAYVKLKVCEILDTTPDSVISLDSDFVPTYTQAHACSYLSSCLKEVIGMLSHRGDTIAERIRSNGKAGATEVGDFMMLQLINRTEVQLRHYLHMEQLHPQELYRVLLIMLGDLSTFSSDSKRPVLDSHYQHNDLGASFRTLMTRIRQVLSMVLEQHAIELPLQTREYGVFVSPMHDPSILGSSSFVLAASAHCDSEELRKHLPSHLKVASVETLRSQVTLHLSGIRIKPLPVAPRQIPFHSDKTYFILEFGAAERAELERSGGFAFHVPDRFAGLELKFWAIRN